MNTTITISTSTPAKLYSQGSIRVSPYDLIKKYSVQDSPNSLSDSNLSSDDQQPIIAHNQKLSESEDFGFSDEEEEEEPGNRGSTRHFLPGPNGFKISGQKIQIYSDGSVTATDAGTGNLGGYSDSEISDQESDDSSYDADCSVLESPRIVVKTSASEVPVKPPRRRSAEKDAARIAEDIERLQLQEERISAESQRASVSSDDMKTFPRSRISGHRPHHHQRHETQSGQASEASLQSRSRSFNGSRESLNIFGSQTDFKNLGISKNFSSDVIREVYGSKTSLLKHLDQQREERRLRQLEDGGRPLVPDHLSRSTDSVLSRDTQPVRSGEPQPSPCHTLQLGIALQITNLVSPLKIADNNHCRKVASPL